MDNRDIWIVEEAENPSTEYYILPALKMLALDDRVRIFNNPPKGMEREKIIIIFIRYLNREWIRFVEKNRDHISKIIYFMDDDLFDSTSWGALPLKYIKKIYMNSYRWKSWLLDMKADFIFSTEYLAKKYNQMNAVILYPYPVLDLPSVSEVIEDSKDDVIKIFYHGTSSHKEEIKWIHHLVKEVLSNNRSIIFEFIGNEKVNKIFKSLERVIVVHPMRWYLYKKFLLSQKRHIGIVPLIDNKFNRARSYTKFFEIVSCGAVGIYSKESCYNKIVSHEKDGILISNDKSHWVEFILKLAEDHSYRLELYFNSLRKFEMLKEIAEKNYKENLIRKLE